MRNQRMTRKRALLAETPERGSLTETEIVTDGRGPINPIDGWKAMGAENEKLIALEDRDRRWRAVQSQLNQRHENQLKAERLRNMQANAKRQEGNTGWGEFDPSWQGIKNFGSNVATVGGGLLSGLRKGAHNLFNDPTRMALLQGGLTAMNPNSYYDQQGFYSTAGGLNRALSSAGNTYQNVINRPVGFKKQKELELQYSPSRFSQNALGQILDKNTGKFVNSGIGSSGGYLGTAEFAQNRNILLAPNADTSSARYASAYYAEAQPRSYFDSTTQTWNMVHPNMSAYRTPTGKFSPTSAQSNSPDGTRITSVSGAGKTKQFRTMMDNVKRVGTSLDTYEKMLKKHGAEVWPSEFKLQMQTAHTDLLMEMKELLNLGVLNGPDLELMEKMLIDPTTWQAMAYEMAGGKDALLAQLDLVRKKLESARVRAEELFGPQRQPNSGSNRPDLVYDKASGKLIKNRRGK